MSTLKSWIPVCYHLCLLAGGWFVAWLLLGDTMLFGGAGFALPFLYFSAKLSGISVAALSKQLPPLVGMLLAGLLLRNLPGNPLQTERMLLGYDFEWWSIKLRTLALAVIMLRAGLGINLEKLRQLGGATARLAACPCMAEALTVALLAGPLLGLPLAWGGTLGFVIAAVSPAVVVPGMLDLQQRGYGTAKGIPTMVVAAASFDDVLAIAGFGICLALAASAEEQAAGGDSSNNLIWLLLKAPVELITGILAGVLLGSLVAARGTHSLNTDMHFMAALLGVLTTVFGGKHVNFSGGGALGALVLGATAARLWPAEALKLVQARVNAFWALVQPALFGLLGAAVNVQALEPAQLGVGVAILAVSLLVRVAVTRLALVYSGLDASEAGLVCLAWLPKATVQAAVGGTALDLMQERKLGAAAEEKGRLVLMISVMVILLTAPIGAIAIAVTGPKLLSCDKDTSATATSAAPASVTDVALKEAEPQTRNAMECAADEVALIIVAEDAALSNAADFKCGTPSAVSSGGKDSTALSTPPVCSFGFSDSARAEKLTL